MITKISLINCFDSTYKSILIRYCLSSISFSETAFLHILFQRLQLRFQRFCKIIFLKVLFKNFNIIQRYFNWKILLTCLSIKTLSIKALFLHFKVIKLNTLHLCIALTFIHSYEYLSWLFLACLTIILAVVTRILIISWI